MAEKKIPIELMAADPAQSAPSAEPQKFSGSDAKKWWWENVKKTPFKMTPERIWGHMERYAAIRTAQLERELADKFSDCPFCADMKRIETRAETAESALRVKEFELETANANHKVMADALRDARELLVECMIPMEALRAVECHINSKALHDDLKKEIVHVTDKVRALLTVAAQTPAQVQNADAGEKEER